MIEGPRLLTIAAGLVLLLSVGTLLVAFFIPVYADDPMFAVIASRAGYDGWMGIHIRPQCETSFLAPIPLSLLPGSVLAWGIYALAEDWFAMRVIALVTYLGWLGVLATVLRYLVWPQEGWFKALAVSMALGTMGIAPLLMIQSRPEATMMLAFSCILCIPLLFAAMKLPPGTQKMGMAIVLLLSSYVVYKHPKALLYSPVIIAACWYFPRVSQKMRLATMAVVALIAVQGFTFWHDRMLCPESTPDHALIQSQSISVVSLIDDPVSAAERFFSNIGKAYIYIQKFLFHPQTQEWVKSLAPQEWLAWFNLTLLGMMGMVALLALGALAVNIRSASRDRQWQSPFLLLPLILLGCMIAQAGLQEIKNFYESTWLWPCLVWLAVLAGAGIPDQKKNGKFVHSILLLLFCGSLISQANMIRIYSPNAIPAMTDDRVYAYSILRSGDYNEEKREIAAQCGIANDSSSRHLVLDLHSYMSMRKTYQPFMYPLLAATPTKEALYAFLNKHDSSGIFTLCASLSPDILQDAQVTDITCCVSKEKLKQFAPAK
jgi:hypothetical protein